jgi:hypothetical protein
VAFQSGSACAAAKRRQRETVALNSLPLRETVATYSTRISIGCNPLCFCVCIPALIFASPPLFFISKKKRQQQPGNRPGPPSGMHPSAPQMQPLLPRSMRLFRLVLARSRCAQLRTRQVLVHLALLVGSDTLSRRPPAARVLLCNTQCPSHAVLLVSANALAHRTQHRLR